MGHRRGRNHYQGNQEGGDTECNPETAAEERNLKYVQSSKCYFNIGFAFGVRGLAV